MTSSNGSIFRVTGHLCGEFTGLRWIPHTKASERSLYIFFDLRPNKRLRNNCEAGDLRRIRHLWHHSNVKTSCGSVGELFYVYHKTYHRLLNYKTIYRIYPLFRQFQHFFHPWGRITIPWYGNPMRYKSEFLVLSVSDFPHRRSVERSFDGPKYLIFCV